MVSAAAAAAAAVVVVVDGGEAVGVGGAGRAAIVADEVVDVERKQAVQLAAVHSHQS